MVMTGQLDCGILSATSVYNNLVMGWGMYLPIAER